MCYNRRRFPAGTTCEGGGTCNGNAVCEGGSGGSTAAPTTTTTTTTSTTTVDPNRCITERGFECVFPFTYRGVTYDSCTSVGQPREWCSTRVDPETGASLNYDFCGGCDNTPDDPCNNRGTFTNGQCSCTQGWSGPTCTECEACNQCADRPPTDPLYQQCCSGTCIAQADGSPSPQCSWSPQGPDSTCGNVTIPFGDSNCWIRRCFSAGVCSLRSPRPEGVNCRSDQGVGGTCDENAVCVSGG